MPQLPPGTVLPAGAGSRGSLGACGCQLLPVPVVPGLTEASSSLASSKSVLVTSLALPRPVAARVRAESESGPGRRRQASVTD